MTRYRIEQDAASIQIKLTDVGQSAPELLSAFGECQQGRCGCPTDEYQKLATMDLDQHGDGIDIRLVAKTGEQLDATEIAACLDYTVAKADRPTSAKDG